MSRRRAFTLGDGKFVIEDEYAQEVYVGIADIDLDNTSVQAASDLLRKCKPRRSELGSLLVTIAFSVGALILGLVIARVCR